MGLPELEYYNAIMACVNRFTKMRYFVLITNKITAEGIANLFINNVYKLHGFPDTIVSN